MLILCPELSKPVEESGQDVAANESSGRPLFAISEPMREEQVQNAVNFLSHPKVRGSPVIYRRSFLEKKGLTKEEIDEAFRRVPVKFSPYVYLFCFIVSFFVWLQIFMEIINYF